MRVSVSSLTRSLIDTCPQEMETWPHKNLHTNAHNSIIHNSQTTETTPNGHQLMNGYTKCGMSINEILFGHKKR